MSLTEDSLHQRLTIQLSSDTDTNIQIPTTEREPIIERKSLGYTTTISSRLFSSVELGSLTNAVALGSSSNPRPFSCYGKIASLVRTHGER
jgi:hypothetical protein